MTLQYRHQTSVAQLGSTGTESGAHFYPCGLIPDPFTTEGEVRRVMTWPKVALMWNGTGSSVPPEETWAGAMMTWIAFFSVTGNVPPYDFIDPYSGNCLLRSALTPAMYHSPASTTNYQVLYTCGAEGIQSKRIVKPQDPVLTAKVITGLWVNDSHVAPGVYSNFVIRGSSTDYTIWSKDV